VVLPSAFKTTLKGYMTSHPYISRAVRARALGVEVAEPEAPGEKEGGGCCACNKRDNDLQNCGPWE
jgi:hypothetical protein